MVNRGVRAKIISNKQKLPVKIKKPAKSFEQQRQRELAWLLYITEGYIANVEHAVTINCVTFNAKDMVAMDTLIRSLSKEADRIRKLMNVITKEG